ncbi:MAG: ABC transporter ATP-binding protein [Bdellovibrionaceae bacterium]|jgi:branched-chain amino acid transport system ATP-binding protein|nr:ABC transporter ATP-binding protein [Pseudobdellovibrionaceae bacterium]
MNEPLLEVRQLSLSFGGIQALREVSFTINAGCIFGLIGPNGAGKTSLFNVITGLYRPSAGRVFLLGEDISGRESHEIIAKGISRTFQNIRLFPHLTVFENVLLGTSVEWNQVSLFELWRQPYYERETQGIQETLQLLRDLELLSLADKIASELSYGQRRRVEIARALMSRPRLLCLDEPAAGLNPQETKQLGEWLKELRSRFHLTLLLIEHDMSLVMKVCEEIAVLDYGRLIAQGSPQEIRQNPEVIKAYLGE